MRCWWRRWWSWPWCPQGPQLAVPSGASAAAARTSAVEPKALAWTPHRHGPASVMSIVSTSVTVAGTMTKLVKVRNIVLLHWKPIVVIATTFSSLVHRRLSLRQPTVPPMMTKLASWQLWVRSASNQQIHVLRWSMVTCWFILPNYFSHDAWYSVKHFYKEAYKGISR